uniref:DNA helicase n=1 Tax=Octopus bimaculoides TaxID=37653 RepID=A0A0L8IAN0_OCTBM
MHIYVNVFSNRRLFEFSDAVLCMSPYNRVLKKNSIVILLRNLDPANCLLNAARFLVLSSDEFYSHGRIITGNEKGNETFITRVDLHPSKTDLHCNMSRPQFPVIPAFAMTINTSQELRKSWYLLASSRHLSQPD